MSRASLSIAVAITLLVAIPATEATANTGGMAGGSELFTGGQAAASGVSEALSRAQIAQSIADQGYFEIADLTRRSDGLWTCSAMREPGRRVTLTVDAAGHIAEITTK